MFGSHVSPLRLVLKDLSKDLEKEPQAQCRHIIMEVGTFKPLEKITNDSTPDKTMPINLYSNVASKPARFIPQKDQTAVKPRMNSRNFQGYIPCTTSRPAAKREKHTNAQAPARRRRAAGVEVRHSKELAGNSAVLLGRLAGGVVSS